MDLLTSEAVANGFTAYWVGDQLRLAHDCRNVTTVLPEPTGALVGWRVRTHRCGTAGSAWHVRRPAQPQPRDPTRPAHLAPRPERRA